MDSEIVGRGELVQCVIERGARVANTAGDIVVYDRGAADVLPNPALFRQALLFRPGHRQLLGASDGSPLAVRNDPKKVMDANHLDDPGDVSD